MKIKFLPVFFLIPVVFLSNGFMVRDKEDNNNSSNDYYQLQRNTCFTSFISNLQKMEALIFVPENKISQAQKLNLATISSDLAKSTNKNFTKVRGEYVQVYPSFNLSDECGKAASLSFTNLEMVCFVRKEKAAKLSDQLQLKLEPGDLYHKIESAAVNASRSEELQIKLGNKTGWQNYLPVTNKITK